MANWRYHMICADGAKADTLSFMAAIGAAGGYSDGLSADGSLPATHWGQSIQLTEAMRQAIDAGTVTVSGVTYLWPPNSWWWRTDANRLVAQQLFRDSNFSGTGASIGSPWTYGDAKGDAGVQDAA